MVDHAFYGIFDGNHAEMTGAGLNVAKYLIDAGIGHGGDGMAEMFEGRGLGEGAFRTEVGDPEGLFQGQAGGDDFAKQARQRVVGQRPPVFVYDPAQYLGFPLGPVIAIIVIVFFERAYVLGKRGALVDQFNQLVVQLIDPFPDRVKLAILCHGRLEDEGRRVF